jgi:alpha-mannosidase
LAGRQGSFLKVDQAGVALVTWKNAENGDGVILRFVEIAGKENEVNVESPLLDVKAGVQDPNLLLETWKPPEDWNGTILRFLDFCGTTRTVTVHTPLLHLKEALETDAVERNENALPLLGSNRFQFPIHPHEIVTIRMVGDSVLPTPTI